MKLCFFKKRDKLTAQIYTNEGHFIHGHAEKISTVLPAFKSGDQWIAEVDMDNDDGPHIAVVSVWIDPDTGVIKVTPSHYMKRQPFTIVKQWLIKLEPV